MTLGEYISSAVILATLSACLFEAGRIRGRYEQRKEIARLAAIHGSLLVGKTVLHPVYSLDLARYKWATEAMASRLGRPYQVAPRGTDAAGD